jgi:hypothetical protein
MAGGMILLGVLLVFMDVARAMVLFGVIQGGVQQLAHGAVVPLPGLGHRLGSARPLLFCSCVPWRCYRAKRPSI